MTERPSWFRLIGAGLVAGAIINICEWTVHAWWFDAAWRDAFAALGKTPTGWSTFIPANLWVGILTVWAYRWLSGVYGSGPRTATRAAIAVWAIFWTIPMLAMQPLAIFPSRLLFLTIVVGVFDVGLATFAGVWLYDGMRSRSARASVE
jgi:hypothetical protein